MKNMKKLFAMALAVMMVLTLATTAFADGVTHSITITGSDAGHTYTAYQIFDGKISGGKLTEITWGASITDGAALLTALKADDTIGSLFGASVVTASDVADVISGTDFASSVTSTAEKLEVFSEIVLKHVNASVGSAAAVDGEGNYVIDVSSTGDGYYLVKDTGTIENEHAATQYILQVLGAETITVKGDAPTSEKKVMDTNDTTGATSGWQYSADYDVGDDVPFKLSATLPTNGFSQYDTYRLVFHDTLSAGLEFNNDVVVKVNGTKIDGGYTVKDTSTCGCSFEVVFNDVKAAPVNAPTGAVITVEYTAELLDTADVGKPGNDNKMHIEYSNDPNWNGEPGDDDEPTGKTPDETVVVFTYSVIVNKVDKDGNALENAGFTLYKQVPDGEDEGTDPDWEIVGTEITGVTTFNFERLDEGKYKLVETTVPAGYNKADDVVFEIVSTLEDEALTKLEVVPADGFTVTLEDGTIKTNVVNQAGATLPETGGIGTTLFYLFGGVMAVGAAVLLVTKKRMAV